MKNDYIAHFGILGQKWGVRRYQNEDGSLTEAGKKRYSKELDEEISKFEERAAKDATDIYVSAHNKTADKVNNGLADKFNAKWKKEHGDFANPDTEPELYDEYVNAWEDMTSKIMQQSYSEVIKEYKLNSKEFQNAKSLIQKYGMLDWNDRAKKFIDEWDS